jgi:hypothetical protein
MFRVSNIRIGVKLAIMSGVAMLLVAVMITGQIINNNRVSAANANNARRNILANAASEAKAALVGMRLGVTYVRFSDDPKTAQAGV